MTPASPSTRPRSSTGGTAPPAPPKARTDSSARDLISSGRNPMSENHDAIVHDAEAGSESRCPVEHGRAPLPVQGGGNRGWWPNQLNLKLLAKNPAVANPLGEDFDYAEAFK